MKPKKQLQNSHFAIHRFQCLKLHHLITPNIMLNTYAFWCPQSKCCEQALIWMFNQYCSIIIFWILSSSKIFCSLHIFFGNFVIFLFVMVFFQNLFCNFLSYRHPNLTEWIRMLKIHNMSTFLLKICETIRLSMSILDRNLGMLAKIVGVTKNQKWYIFWRNWKK